MKHAVLALSLLCGWAHAETWIVETASGPGVDFTTIQEAIDVAAPGDTIRIGPGDFDAFDLESRPLRVLGTAGLTTILGRSEVRWTAVTEEVVLADLEFRELWLSFCDGPVVLSSVRTWWPWAPVSFNAPPHEPLRINDCRDVRLHDVEAVGDYWIHNSAMRVLHSRVEATSCTFIGRDGLIDSAQDGGTAIKALQESRIHLALCNAEGGEGGGDGGCGFSQDSGGDGGHGVHAGTDPGTGTEILVRGRATNWIRGGLSGYICSAGTSGCAARVENGTLRVSEVSLQVGPVISSACGNWTPPFLPPVPDPWLELRGTPTVGLPVVLDVTAEPGDHVILMLSTEAVVGPVIAPLELLIGAGLDLDLGTVKPSGIVTWSQIVPASWSDSTWHVQAMIKRPDGSLALTNAVPIVVR